MINMLIKFTSLIFHGLGQSLFGAGIITLVYFLFFSTSDNRYLYSLIAVCCVIGSLGIYFLGEKASDTLFWRKKDRKSRSGNVNKP